jgi:hypothetical protein
MNNAGRPECGQAVHNLQNGSSSPYIEVGAPGSSNIRTSWLHWRSAPSDRQTLRCCPTRKSPGSAVCIVLKRNTMQFTRYATCVFQYPRRVNTKVSQTKGNIIGNELCDDLVFGILERQFQYPDERVYTPSRSMPPMGVKRLHPAAEQKPSSGCRRTAEHRGESCLARAVCAKNTESFTGIISRETSFESRRRMFAVLPRSSV